MKRRERALRAFVGTLRASGLDMRARELEEILGPLPRRVKPRAASKAKRDAKRQERAKRWQEIRVSVMERANGICEVCQMEVAEEAHHVISGPERRHMEMPATVVAACRFCHRALHANEVHALNRVLELPWLASQAYRAVRRRLDKLGSHPEHRRSA